MYVVEISQQMLHQMQQVSDIELAGHIMQQHENVHMYVIYDILKIEQIVQIKQLQHDEILQFHHQQVQQH